MYFPHSWKNRGLDKRLEAVSALAEVNQPPSKEDD
jgi:hypothetical protein